MSFKVNQEHSRSLDQFYTDPSFAKFFYNDIKNTLNLEQSDILLEPSAGTGNFYRLMDPQKRIGLDIEPKYPGIIQQDFFNWNYPINKNIITIGNPPFGKNSSLSIKFFNHAAKFSESIAFILPRTFRKASVINRLNDYFHNIYDQVVPDYSFILNEKPYNVCCCSQIWIRKKEQRRKIIPLKKIDFIDWFEFVDSNLANFSIQRVGGAAGLIRTKDFKHYSPSSHFFIRSNFDWVIKIFQKIDFNRVKFNTVGNPSISPSELVFLWQEKALEMKQIKKINILNFMK